MNWIEIDGVALNLDQIVAVSEHAKHGVTKFVDRAGNAYFLNIDFSDFCSTFGIMRWGKQPQDEE